MQLYTATQNLQNITIGTVLSKHNLGKNGCAKIHFPLYVMKYIFNVMGRNYLVA